ncbi:MAG TPA: hypothetical protein VHG32_26150 [Thermoanaerobaculia bacterium]|jgi:hypothetical protein|nr:hypothetical protein [Thermoanaerobaculia bacterium]
MRRWPRIAAALGVSVPDLLALASIARRFRGVETPAGGVETGGDRRDDLPDLRPQLVALLRAEVEPAAGDVRQARRTDLDSGRQAPLPSPSSLPGGPGHGFSAGGRSRRRSHAAIGIEPAGRPRPSVWKAG